MDLRKVLEATLHMDGETRRQAERALEEAEKNQGYLGTIFGVVMESSVQAEVRQAASIRFKHRITRADWNDENSNVLNEEKIFLRENLVNAVVHSPPRVRAQLLQAVRSIILYDFPERWPGVANQAFDLLNNQNPQQVVGAVLILRQLSKRYEYKDRDSRGPLWEVLKHCFQRLTGLFEHINTLPVDNDIAELQKNLCKIWWSSTQMIMPPFILNDQGVKEIFDKWMACFLTVMRQEVPAGTDVLSPLWKVKKWIGHIVTRFLQTHGNTRRASDAADKALGQHFIDNHLTKFVEAWFGVFTWYQQGVKIAPPVLSLALNCATQAMDIKESYTLVMQHMQALLDTVVLPLLCFNDDDQEQWEDDPAEYVRKLGDPMQDFYNPRSSAAELLRKCTSPDKKYHTDDALHMVGRRINEVLQNCKAQGLAQAQSTNPAVMPLARQKDGVMFAVGIMTKSMRNKSPYKEHIESMLVETILPDFMSQFHFLRAKAVWVVSRYAQIEWKNPQALKAAFNGCVELMRDPELPVRVQAATALSRFMKNKGALEECVQARLMDIVTCLFRLMTEIADSDEIINTLESLIDRYGEHLAGAAMTLLQTLVQHFRGVMPKTDSENVDLNSLTEADFEAEENQSLAASACLRAIYALITAVENHTELYPQMSPLVLGLVELLLQHDKIDYLDETLEICTRFTFLADEIPREWWRLFPVLCHAATEWAQDFVGEMLATLDNFITKDTETFAKEGMTLPGQSQPTPFLEMFVEFARRVVSLEDVDRELLTVVPKLVSAVLQHSADYQAQVSPYVPRLFDIILGSVFELTKSRDLGDAFLTLCAGVICDGLFYDAKLTLEYLAHKQVLVPVMDDLLHRATKLKRRYDRKVFALGLTAIFKLLGGVGVGALPQYFTPEKLMTMAGTCFKLVLLSTQQAKEEDKAKEEEGSEDDDDLGDADDLDDEWDSDDLDEEEDEGEVGKEKSLEDIVKDAKAQGLFENLTDEDELEDEEYVSLIDEVEEAIYLQETLTALMATSSAQLAAQIESQLSAETKQQFAGAVQYAHERKRKREEDN